MRAFQTHLSCPACITLTYARQPNLSSALLVLPAGLARMRHCENRLDREFMLGNPGTKLPARCMLGRRGEFERLAYWLPMHPLWLLLTHSHSVWSWVCISECLSNVCMQHSGCSWSLWMGIKSRASHYCKGRTHHRSLLLYYIDHVVSCQKAPSDIFGIFTFYWLWYKIQLYTSCKNFSSYLYLKLVVFDVKHFSERI